MITDAGISDEELTAPGPGRRPGQPLAPDAVPFQGEPDARARPPARLVHAPTRAWAGRRPTRRAVAVAVVAAALLINGLGFCITYGQLSAG